MKLDYTQVAEKYSYILNLSTNIFLQILMIRHTCSENDLFPGP